MNLGYACINQTLGKKITTNRSMIKRTFLEKGIEYASSLALKNCKDLLTILRWNEEHNIRFFRLSSDLFPWSSEYELKSLPSYEEIKNALCEAGKFAQKYNHRITTHPGPFNALGSPRNHVVENTLKELERHSEVFDLMGLETSPYAKINIHVGGIYGGDFEGTSQRWISNYNLLSESCRSRITLENDDKSSMWSVKDLYEQIYKKCNVPIVFDFHHHNFCNGGLSEKEALEMALSTWGKVMPVVHYSQSRSEEYQDSKIKPQAHSDSYWKPFNLHGNDADVMLECKAKEQGLFKMLDLLCLPFKERKV